MKTLFFATAAVAIALSTHAFADQWPRACARGGDPRVGCLDYRPDEVYKLWTVPEASILVKIGDDEKIDAATGADVCPPPQKDKSLTHDNCSIEAAPRGNLLFVKFWRCVIPSPLQMESIGPDGKRRIYNFEVHTEPMICPPEPQAKPEPTKRDWQLVNAANAAVNAADAPVGSGNLKYASVS